MKYIFIWPCLQLLFALFTYLSAACTGNSLGNCEDPNPQNCPITRANVGTALGATEDVNAGRTSYAQYAVPFVHDGGSSTFTVSLETSGQDSGTSITEAECLGRVTAFFTDSGEKLLKVRVYDINWVRTMNSSNSFRIIYDKVPPILQISRVIVGSELTAAGQVYSSGMTYHTSTEISIRARVTDPAPSAPAKDFCIKVVEGLSNADFKSPIDENSGEFASSLGISAEPDGEYVLRIAAYDGASGKFLDGSPANRSEPLMLRIVKDTAEPIMTDLEIIRNPESSNPIVERAPGVFIRDGTVRVRAKFNEKLKSPPSLRVVQEGDGSGTPQEYIATYDVPLFNSNPSVVEYVFAPLVGAHNIGPASFIFEEGLDLSGNPLNTNEGVLKGFGGEMERAVIIDTVPPDLNRVDVSIPGRVQTTPSNGARLPKNGFPDRILAIVRDYNQIDDGTFEAENIATNNASGVDFSKVMASGSEALSIELLRPDGKAVAGELVTQPPNGLLYLLPSEKTIFADTNGVSPEGVYTVRVTLIDKVGNRGVETFYFNMDTTPIRADSIQVSLLPDASGGAESGNPYLVNPIHGKAIPDSPDLVDLGTLNSVRLLEAFTLCSTDKTFSLTESAVELKARLNGPDTVGRSMNVSGAVNLSDAENTCGASGSITYQVHANQREAYPELTFNFPNPAAVGTHVPIGERDPRFGRFDGPYGVEVVAVDDAGNRSKNIKKEFLLDTIPPYSSETFPQNYEKINVPLRHVSAILVDPHPPKLHTWDQEGYVNFGSGISVTHSGIKLFLQSPYGSPDPAIYGEDNRLRGALTYIHRPNSTDPDSPSYDPKDDSYRVLLEFIDKKGTPVTLPANGNADGIYRLEVTPVDNAGNSIEQAASGSAGGFNVSGLTEKNRPQELRRDFYFLLDTVAPSLTIDRQDGQEITELKVSGQNFSLTGKTRDLSAKSGQGALSGGAGIDRVEYEVVLLRQDGSLVPSVPGDSNTKAKNNPIVTARQAVLSPIGNSSNDPHVSSTRPLDPATYGDITLEERAWTIADQLPPFNEILTSSDMNSNYWLKIFSYDLAGNRTERSVRLILRYGTSGGFGRLSPPEQLEPVNNKKTKDIVVNFRWRPVAEAAKYILNISHPDGKTTTHEVQADSDDTKDLKHMEILNKEGLYTWWLFSSDSVGNLSDQSFYWNFTMDKTAPLVKSMNWLDLSPEARGKLTIGKFQMNLVFSEVLSTGPEVSFQPFGTSVEAQQVATVSLSGSYWSGMVTVPESATYLWDGLATVEIKNAVDGAGNKMVTDKSHNFEIKTGPAYQVSFFQNPVFRSEIIFLVKSSERLLNPPTLFSPEGFSFVNRNLLPVSDQSYSAVFKVLNVGINQGTFKITGSDLLGNPATRTLTFPIQNLNKSSKTVLQNSYLRIELPAYPADEALAVLFPAPEVDFSADSNLENSNLAKSVNLVAETTPEGFFRVQTLGLLHSDVDLNVPMQLTLAEHISLAAHQGLFVENGGQLSFVEAIKNDHGQISAVLTSTGRLSVFEDRLAPKLELLDDYEIISPRQAEIKFLVQDIGSGVVPESVLASIGSYHLNCQPESDDIFICRSSSHLATGDYELNLQAVDRLSNRSVLKSSVAVVGPVKITAFAVPNPARSFSLLHYDLNKAAQELELRIYDSSGNRIFHVSSATDFNLSVKRGRNSFSWDLQNNRGGIVANGVYFAEFRVTDFEQNTDQVRLKVAVIR